MAFYLRIEGLFDPTFHADEALFATWSRKIFALHDLLLVGEPADKPPLLFYLQSLTYNLLTPTQFAARIPNLIASMALIPLCAYILPSPGLRTTCQNLAKVHHTAVKLRLFKPSQGYAHDNLFAHPPSSNLLQKEGDRSPSLWGGLRGGDWGKSLTMFIIAIHPLTIKYSPTAFTDPLMLTLSIAALATIHKRPFISGLLYALAITTKYHALIFTPLILCSLRASVVKKWLAGLTIPVIIFTLWLVLPDRTIPFTQTGDSVLLRGIRPIHSYELLPRFTEWQLWLPISIALAYGTVCKTATDRLLALFLLGYCTLLWLFSFPIYERYLLPTIPLITIGIVRTLQGATSGFEVAPFDANGRTAQKVVPRTQRYYFVIPLIVMLIIWFTFQSKMENRPNLQPIITTLQQQPAETVLYDHYYSWQLRYFLYDNHTVYTAWIPHADALITDLNAFYTTTPPRLLLLPTHHSSLTTNHYPLITSYYTRRLNAAGYRLHQLTTTDTITLYQVVSDEVVSD